MLPITVTEKDAIAVGAEEGSIPSLDACALVQSRQEKFCETLDWTGPGVDTVKEVPSPRIDRSIVVVIHRIPRFAARSLKELGKEWEGLEPITRITTLTFQEGDLDYIVEDGERSSGELALFEWVQPRQWCGQTVFTFPRALETPLEEKLIFCNLQSLRER